MDLCIGERIGQPGSGLPKLRSSQEMLVDLALPAAIDPLSARHFRALGSFTSPIT
jgi:hypothetical protein